MNFKACMKLDTKLQIHSDVSYRKTVFDTSVKIFMYSKLIYNELWLLFETGFQTTPNLTKNKSYFSIFVRISFAYLLPNDLI